MKKINRKGFSLVELLATITIIGILSTTAVIAYSRYKEKAKIQAYDTLAKSAMHAADEYLMDNPGTEKVTLNTLYDELYLERPADPTAPEKECTGNVIPTAVTSTGKELDTYTYKINICCNNYNYEYSYTYNASDDLQVSKNTITADKCE